MAVFAACTYRHAPHPPFPPSPSLPLMPAGGYQHTQAGEGSRLHARARARTHTHTHTLMLCAHRWLPRRASLRMPARPWRSTSPTWSEGCNSPSQLCHSLVRCDSSVTAYSEGRYSYSPAVHQQQLAGWLALLVLPPGPSVTARHSVTLTGLPACWDDGL